MMLVYGTPGIPLFSRAMTMTPHDTHARNDQQGQLNSKIKTNLFCRGEGGATFLQIIVTGSQTIWSSWNIFKKLIWRFYAGVHSCRQESIWSSGRYIFPFLSNFLKLVKLS